MKNVDYIKKIEEGAWSRYEIRKAILEIQFMIDKLSMKNEK